MKVILLDYVYKHGVAGEVINVADGFARNYLIPKKLAVKATSSELKRAEKLREQAATRRAALENRLNELARVIDGVELLFERRAAVTGKLFGSVTTQEIADSLMEKTGVDINRRRISQQPLREIGTHDVPVRLGTEISPVLKVTIMREGELAAFLAQQEAAEAGEEAVEAVETADMAEAEGMLGDDEIIEPEDATAYETEVLPKSMIDDVIESIESAASTEKAASNEEAASAEEAEDADTETRE